MTHTPHSRWETTLWIVLVAQFISAAGFAVMFPFLPLYVYDLGTNTGLSLKFWTGMVFSSQAVTMAIASPIWGALADRFGYKLMVERSMFGGAIILFLMAFARSAEELALLRAIQGVITGVISANNALVASMAPRNRLGYAMGLLQFGLWSGIAAGPLIGGVIADAMGFRITFIITAVSLLIAGFLVLFGVPASTKTPRKAARRSGGVIGDWGRIIKSQGVALAYTLRFLIGLGRTTIVPFAPLFIQLLLPSTERLGTLTGLMVGLSSATGTATAIYLGRLGDRIGHRQILIVSAFVTALLYVMQGFVTEAWQLLLLQALSGAALGGATPALSALLANYTQPGEEGAVYGLDNSVLSAARGVAPLIGAGVAAWIGLRGIFLVTAAIFFFITALAALRLPPSSAAQQPQVA